MAGAAHLVRRFVGSLRPGGPGAEAEAWVRTVLQPGEVELWVRMSRPDRRHAVRVARDVQRRLGHEPGRPVLAAALLHDVGKADAELGTYGRVVATLSGRLAGHEFARLWTTRRGFTRKVGLYLLHPELGGDQLALAGSDPLTVAWAREHHLPEDRWTVPAHLAHALKAADDD
jgi:hypothetical protein